MDQTREQWVNETIEKIRIKMNWVSDKNKDKIPYTTRPDGSYDDRADKNTEYGGDDGLNWWTNGFWGGLMWLMYQDTGEQKYADYARSSEQLLEQCFTSYYGLHHDVGFMYQPTAVADYRLTGNSESRRIGLHAANLLAGRFNPAGNFIRAWNDPGEGDDRDTKGWAIIDCLMNLSLLYWASEETGDPRFKHVATMHADTVIKHFVRADGSVNHIVEFDPETGAFNKSYGGQGYAEGSAWTRGQGWAVYGFMISYRHTGRSEYLETAKKVAAYCISQMGADGIIPIDFAQPAEPALEDSCGACIIAGGLLELAAHVSPAEQEYYLNAAIKILEAIDKTRADWGTGCDAIVKNCSSAYYGDRHINMVYADYYFIEAIYKLKKTGIFIW